VLELRPLGHVARHRDRTPPEPSNHRRRLLDLLRRPRRAHDVGPHLGKRLGDRPTDAASSACDDRHLPIEPKAVENHAAFVASARGNREFDLRTTRVPALPRRLRRPRHAARA
jgi:hypothetical protein